MAPLGLAGSAVWVGHQVPVADDPSQPGWVVPVGRGHQHRLGLGRGVVGEVVGAVGQHGGVGGRELAGA